MNALRRHFWAILIRLAASWRTCNKLDKIWNSSLSRPFKLRVFAATVESVLTYGCEAWTLSPRLSKSLDGCYTRMLRKVLNISWKQHLTNKELYGDLPKLSHKISVRRRRFAGHCYRSKKEPVSKLVLWTPKHGTRSRGKPATNFIDTLCKDTELQADDLGVAMEDRTVWRTFLTRRSTST